MASRKLNVVASRTACPGPKPAAVCSQHDSASARTPAGHAHEVAGPAVAHHRKQPARCRQKWTHGEPAPLPIAPGIQQAPPPANSASGHACQPDRSLASTAIGANSTSPSRAPASNREGRQSHWNITDLLDKRCDFDIRGHLMPQEPAPECVVFDVQKPQENGALGGRTSSPLPFQPPVQQLIKLTHPAPATPAQFFSSMSSSITPCAPPSAS